MVDSIGAGTGDVENPLKKNLDADGNEIRNVGDLTAQTGKIIDTSELSDTAVTAAKLAASAVQNSKIASGAVDSNEIASAAVTAAKIAAGAVDSNELATDAVTAAEIAASAVGSSELDTDAVDSSAIASGAVDSDEITTDAVTAAEIAGSAVDTSELSSDAVTSGEIASGAVDTSEIATDAVDTNELATGAVTKTEVTFSAFYKVAEVSSDTTMVPGGHYFVNAGSGDVTMTLPSPLDGNRATVKKISGSGNDVIVARPSGNPIDTVFADDTISNQFTARTYIFKGSNWWVI